MMFAGLTGIHLLIILGIVILLFGATKLPALAKGLGQSINIFKKEMGEGDKKSGDQGVQNTAATDATVPNTTAQNTAAQPAGPVLNPGPSVQPNTDSNR
ncbi:sec-independent protein translocase protein TatA [Curtobacterium luteum]|uniref:Sec-independent protein translocase protein TatA n=2 Tax=Curtobacterium luteum TaxID=33881 RepID=A0ABS2RYS5_9MICO|nr:sec-independent protein translocase protein TatA [Curtobacterium luteum]